MGDMLAGGRAAWKEVVSGFWGPFQQATASLDCVAVREVIDQLDATLGEQLFAAQQAQQAEQVSMHWGQGRHKRNAAYRVRQHTGLFRKGWWHGLCGPDGQHSWRFCYQQWLPHALSALVGTWGMLDKHAVWRWCWA